MGSITATQFVHNYGYITDGEEDPSVLSKRTEAVLSLFPPESKVQPNQNACLFFDADGTPCLDTYEHRISAQPSYVTAERYAYRCYKGEIFRETKQKAHELFAKQIQLAQACMTWKEGEARSVQNIRDRTRRLQVLQMERSSLYAALQKGKEAYARFIAHLSTFQKVMFSACSLFSSRTADFTLPTVPPLPNSPHFSDLNPIILPSISLTIGKNEKIDVILEGQVLQGIDLAHPLELGYRFGTLVTVKAAETNKQFGQVSFVREKDSLIAMIKPEDYQHKEILTKLAQYIFMRDPAATMHIRCGEQDGLSINIRKEAVQDPTYGKCFKVSVFGLEESALISDTAYVPFLPQGNDRPPNDLTSHKQHQDVWTALADLYKYGQALLHSNGK